MYIILALLIIAVMIVFAYKRYSIERDKSAVAPTETFVPVESETSRPSAEEPEEVIVVAEEVISEAEPNLPEVPLSSEMDDSRAAMLISEAKSYIEAEPARIIEARDRLNEALPLPMTEQQREFVKQQLSDLSERWLFSRTIFPQDKLCGSYKVESGDLLSTIGRYYKVPYEILMEINSIGHASSLRAGEVIKVINGPFHVRVYRSTFTADLFLQNTYVRSFKVGLGMPGRETPTGLWVVKSGGKLIKPTWTDPDTGQTYEPEDPNYPLGSRWIGLEGLKGDAVGRTGIAFHGTKDSNLIGTAGSRGCIRLHNGDVVLLYNLLVPEYSQVEVVE